MRRRIAEKIFHKLLGDEKNMEWQANVIYRQNQNENENFIY